MSLDEITSKHLAGTDTTVIRTLRTRETILGPAKDLTIGVKEGVLLLETEPRFGVLGGVHHLLAVSSVIGLVRGTVVVVTFTENENVGATSEGILEDRNRTLSEGVGAISTNFDGRMAIKDVGGYLRGRHQSYQRGPGWWKNHRSSTP